MIPLLLVNIGNYLPVNSMGICGSHVNWPFLIPTSMYFICCSSFTSDSYYYTSSAPGDHVFVLVPTEYLLLHFY